jgi:hypothetical protein
MIIVADEMFFISCRYLESAFRHGITPKILGWDPPNNKTYYPNSVLKVCSL